MKPSFSLYGGLLGGAAALTILFSVNVSSHAADEAKTDTDHEVRFGHKRHSGLGVKIEGNCQTCHGIKGFDVEPVTRGRDHQPCNNSGCHADEYMSREPTICVVCHDSTDPWVKQQARLRQFKTSEFGADISHKVHLAGSTKCQSCHGNRLANEERPEGHAVCGACHTGGLEPKMSDCGACHKLGFEEALQTGASKYSVRDLFDHRAHDRDPRDKSRSEPACTLCHADVDKSETLTKLTPPTMQSCDACHDGKLAFKTTGFECVKCHGEAGR